MKKALLQSAVRTFEEFAFAIPTELTDGSKIDPATSFAVAVDFTGPMSGRLELQIEKATLAELAANMVGEPEELDAETERDVLREFANVICGNTLPIIRGTTEIFHLSAPVDLDTPMAQNADAHLELDLDGGRADVSLFIDK